MGVRVPARETRVCATFRGRPCASASALACSSSHTGRKDPGAQHAHCTDTHLRSISLKTRRIKIGTFVQNCLDRSRVQSDEWSCKGDKQMARTTKQTKTPATSGFAIEIKDDTELGLAILVAVYAGGGYRPIGWRSASARRARSRKATGATTPAPPSRSTSCGRRAWKATTSGWRPTMTTFTIDTDNNITAHAAAPAAQDNLVAFATEKEFTKATADWPIARFTEVWNAFAGVPPFGDLKPTKKFTDRKTAAMRIWKAIQVLGEELLRTSIRDAEAKLKAARTAPTPAPQVAPSPRRRPRLPRLPRPQQTRPRPPRPPARRGCHARSASRRSCAAV